MSTDVKLPLLELVSKKLESSACLKPLDTDRVVDYIDTLSQAKLTASEAHEIAAKHEGLPALLKAEHYNEYADLAEEMLAKLRNQTDEEKPETTE